MTTVSAYRGGRVSEDPYPGFHIQEAYVVSACPSADLPDGGRAVNLGDHRESTRWGTSRRLATSIWRAVTGALSRAKARIACLVSRVYKY